jgi:transcriptional regulator with XRE-family HTH domain
MVTDKDLCDFLREEIKSVGMTQGQIAERSGLSRVAVHNFQYSKCGTSLRIFLRLAWALGYDFKLVPNGTIETKPIEVKVVMKRTKEYSETSEYACLKCGHDAGVDEVHGHLQCSHCGHIMQDCCGD